MQNIVNWRVLAQKCVSRRSILIWVPSLGWRTLCSWVIAVIPGATASSERIFNVDGRDTSEKWGAHFNNFHNHQLAKFCFKTQFSSIVNLQWLLSKRVFEAGTIFEYVMIKKLGDVFFVTPDVFFVFWVTKKTSFWNSNILCYMAVRGLETGGTDASGHF